MHSQRIDLIYMRLQVNSRTVIETPFGPCSVIMTLRQICDLKKIIIIIFLKLNQVCVNLSNDSLKWLVCRSWIVSHTFCSVISSYRLDFLYMQTLFASSDWSNIWTSLWSFSSVETHSRDHNESGIAVRTVTDPAVRLWIIYTIIDESDESCSSSTCNASKHALAGENHVSSVSLAWLSARFLRKCWAGIFFYTEWGKHPVSNFLRLSDFDR